jgi:hypothetical protein
MTTKEKKTNVYVLHEKAVFEYEKRQTIRGIWSSREEAEKYIANAQRYLKRKLSEGVEVKYTLNFWIREYTLDEKDPCFGNRINRYYPIAAYINSYSD